jgi:magnesium transporter
VRAGRRATDLAIYAAVTTACRRAPHNRVNASRVCPRQAGIPHVIAHVCARANGEAPVHVLTAHAAQLDSLDVRRYELLWVDVAEPQPEDIAWLEHTFGFHRLALEDVARQHQRAKLDDYPGYYFGVLYVARVDLVGRHITTAELQFFWGATYLVTVHSAPMPEIEHLAARARDGTLTPVVGADRRQLEIADLAYHLVDAVVDSYFPAVDAIAEWSDGIEEAMFAITRRPAQATLQAIFGLKKDLVEMRKVVAPGREVVNVVLRREHARFSEELMPYFQDVYDHIVRVTDSLDVHRDLLASALDTYLSIVSNDVSQTVKKMTAVTAILMVDALVAGVYGMNFDRMPELHWEYGYAYALALMALLSLGLAALFRRIRWW